MYTKRTLLHVYRYVRTGSSELMRPYTRAVCALYTCGAVLGARTCVIIEIGTAEPWTGTAKKAAGRCLAKKNKLLKTTSWKNRPRRRYGRTNRTRLWMSRGNRRVLSVSTSGKYRATRSPRTRWSRCGFNGPILCTNAPPVGRRPYTTYYQPLYVYSGYVRRPCAAYIRRACVTGLYRVLSSVYLTLHNHRTPRAGRPVFGNDNRTRFERFSSYAE